MLEKRYAIVRVDKLKFCPSDIEGIDDKLVCSKTKDGKSKVCVCRYGDTKGQLIRKIAQIIFKAKLERYRQVWKFECSEMEKKERYNGSLSLAKEIVEFLGVK